MYKKDLALNNLQWLIYHKTQLNQIYLLKRISVVRRNCLNFLAIKFFQRMTFLCVTTTPTYEAVFVTYMRAY